MSTQDRLHVRGPSETQVDDTSSPELHGKSEEKPLLGGDAKRKPSFRIARLDGRDTLKYEDTADK